ncbi:unnamed protein product [Tilletia caries]|uniref:Uncharacterized protein n=1 Tax=Tilletia controversa TaxID=13291 RepID=A0A8X7MLT7_9BASI|nr:hypothetical protein A4X06_0g7881 [Tilletia controversa]CAD6891478.1 unnamed protein product [Tilletia caries]CAD6949339.1 unnamed protein product [Tilletia caries]
MARTSALNAAKAAGTSKQARFAAVPAHAQAPRTRSVPVSAPPPAAAAVMEGEATLAASPAVEAVEQGDVAAKQEDGAAALPANAVHLDATAAGESMPDNNHVDLPAAGADGKSALAGRVADDEEIRWRQGTSLGGTPKPRSRTFDRGAASGDMA